MVTIGRRQLLGTGAALLGATTLPLLAACGGGNGGGPANSGGGGGGNADIALSWWGNPDRDKRTNQAIKDYEAKHSNVKIQAQTTNWDSYWDKFNTEIAGGNPPDVIQMDYAYINGYANRGNLLALDEYVPSKLNISDFGDKALAPGKVNGKLYGVNMGINSFALITNTTVLDGAGQQSPTDKMTWSDFADVCKAVGASKKGMVGTENEMLNSSNLGLECWLRERGKALYTDDGKSLGFDKSDLAEWYAYWQDLVKAGGAATAGVQTAIPLGNLAAGLVAQGKAAFAFAWSNQLSAYSGVSKDKIAMYMYPQGDGSDAKPGQYLKASMFLSISSKTKYKDASVAFANALVAVPDIAKDLGFERGYPPSPTVRKALLPDATDDEKSMVSYIDDVQDKVGDTPPAPPNASATVRKALNFAAQQVAFGKEQPKDAIDKAFTDSAKALTS